MRIRIALSLLAALALACAWHLTATRAAESHAELSVGSAAPQFSAPDQGDKTVSLSDFPGRIVVLEWTNPNCPYVQLLYKSKTMVDLADKYKASGVVWLAIDSNQGESAGDIQSWAKENHLPFSILNDGKQEVARAYSAKSTPDMFVIGKDGKIAYEGAIDNDPEGDKTDGRVNYVQQALDELLAGKAVSIPQTKSYGCGVHAG